MIVRGRGDQTLIETGDETEIRNIRFPQFVRDYFSSRKLARRPGLAPLSGGAVGYFAYGAAHWFEPALPSPRVDESCFDDAVLMFFRNVLAFDRSARADRHHLSCVHRRSRRQPHAFARTLRTRHRRNCAHRRRYLRYSVHSQPRNSRTSNHDSKPDFVYLKLDAGKTFRMRCGACKEHIAAGDCYQVVLSQCFRKSVCASPLSVYRALRTINPSPYMYFLRLGRSRSSARRLKCSCVAVGHVLIIVRLPERGLAVQPGPKTGSWLRRCAAMKRKLQNT